MQDKRNLLWVPTIIACSLALYVAIGHPSIYGFYTLARIAVTASAIILACSLREPENKGIQVACISAAILFNPIIPLDFGREIWVILDFGVVLLLTIATISATKVSSN